MCHLWKLWEKNARGLLSILITKIKRYRDKLSEVFNTVKKISGTEKGSSWVGETVTAKQDHRVRGNEGKDAPCVITSRWV